MARASAAPSIDEHVAEACEQVTLLKQEHATLQGTMRDAAARGDVDVVDRTSESAASPEAHRRRHHPAVEPSRQALKARIDTGKAALAPLYGEMTAAGERLQTLPLSSRAS